MELLTEDIIKKVRQDNCFDFLRYLFAISLIIAHFCTLTDEPQLWFITGRMRVKAFFTITGFLVTYSFLRRNKDIYSYAIKRFVRIIPAYLACVIFCFFMGLAVTSLPTLEFLSSSQTWRYLFANTFMLNWLEHELPQTFQGNLMPEMNGSLWSMKQEVVFYFLVPLFMWLMRNEHKRNLLCGMMVILCVLLYNIVNVQTQYFMYFIIGMVLLMYFDKFCKWQKALLPVAVFMLIPVYALEIPCVSVVCEALEPLCFPMVIVGAAYNLKPLNVFRKYDNVTYGLYLYHFPIIQLLIHYGMADKSLTLTFLVALIATAVMACLSWFLIEKPLMNRYR